MDLLIDFPVICDSPLHIRLGISGVPACYFLPPTQDSHHSLTPIKPKQHETIIHKEQTVQMCTISALFLHGFKCCFVAMYLYAVHQHVNHQTTSINLIVVQY